MYSGIKGRENSEGGGWKKYKQHEQINNIITKFIGVD